MSDETIESKMKRASDLKMQCKKHQIFHEKALEAEKMSEAGHLHTQIGLALTDDAEGRTFHYEEAAVCLARAKRLCTDLVRGR